MMLSGRGFWILLLVVFAAARSQAALEVAVDRQEVALGDSIRLVITATADEDLDALDLRRLLADFEILQRSATSSTPAARFDSEPCSASPMARPAAPMIAASEVVWMPNRPRMKTTASARIA